MMTNLCPSKLESTMVEHLSLLTVTLSTDEKLGRDRHRCRSQVPDGRNQIVPEISTPRFELMSTTGVMPSEVRPAGMQGIASLQKMKSTSRQTSGLRAVVGYDFNRVVLPNAAAQARRGRDVRHGKEMRSRRWLQSLGWALHSFVALACIEDLSAPLPRI